LFSLQLFYRCALWNLAILATETNKCDLIWLPTFTCRFSQHEEGTVSISIKYVHETAIAEMLRVVHFIVWMWKYKITMGSRGNVLTANAVHSMVAWTDKVSNEQILQTANTSRNLLKVIVSRQIWFVGHFWERISWKP